MAEGSTNNDEAHFLLAIRRLADSLGYGADASPLVGSGVDYAQSRPYMHGDSIKAMDWRVTARTGRPFVKEYEAHKRIPIYIVVDNSASMWATSVARSKFEWAVQLAGALALTGLDHLNPVGLFGCETHDLTATRPLRFRPSLSMRETLGWLHRLRAQASPGSGPAGIAAMLRDVVVEATDRSVIIILSDLHEADVVGPIRRAARRHDVIVLRLRDPAEGGRTNGGIFRAVEAETAARFVTSGRRAFPDGGTVMAELRQASVDAITLGTDRQFIPELRRFLECRNLARSGR